VSPWKNVSVVQLFFHFQYKEMSMYSTYKSSNHPVKTKIVWYFTEIIIRHLLLLMHHGHCTAIVKYSRCLAYLFAEKNMHVELWLQTDRNWIKTSDTYRYHLYVLQFISGFISVKFILLTLYFSLLKNCLYNCMVIF